MDSAARCHRDRATDGGAISPRSRVEGTGWYELVIAEAGAAGQRAECGAGRILEDGAVAGDKKNAAQQRAWIFFEDESGFSQQPSIRRTWAPRGQTPVLKARGNHWSRTSVAAALGFRWDGGRSRLLARSKPDSHDTESLMAFLKDLKRFVQGRRVILVWDHLPAHRSKVMKRFLFEQRAWLQIEWLPGYAPDLNPAEGVWNNIKAREMANFCPDYMDEAVAAFGRGLKRVTHSRRLRFAFLLHAGLLF